MIGRITSRSCALAVAMLCALSVAHAKVTEKTTYYSISGETGEELFNDMNRRGPKHGFLTKAIAQTQFKTELLGDIVHRNGVCRTKGAAFVLHITYVYPQPKTRLTGALARRWRAFQATNVAHEQHHGLLAKRMAAAVDRTMRNFSMADGSSCSRAAAKLGREIDRIIIPYNKAQSDFDAREHRPGGPVEKSIVALVVGRQLPGEATKKRKPKLIPAEQAFRLGR